MPRVMCCNQNKNCYDCPVTDPYIRKIMERTTVKSRGTVRPRQTSDFAKSFPDVKWNTEPLLANPVTFWKDWWDAKTWLAWHALVKKKYGVKRANEVFIEWFRKAPFASPTTDFRTFDTDFITYAKANGFYDGLFEGVLGATAKTAGKLKGTAEKIVTSAGNVVEGVGDTIENTSETLGFLGKNFKWIIAAVVVVVLIGVWAKFK